MPKGVIAGVSIEGFLRRLVDPTTGTTDFRKLPIPFSAVAADIETGEAVGLDHGSLSTAPGAATLMLPALAPAAIVITAPLSSVTVIAVPAGADSDAV